MKKQISITIILSLIIIAVMHITLLQLMNNNVEASGFGYNFNETKPSSLDINSSSDQLYVSYYVSNSVLEINTSTMTIARNFAITKPSFIRTGSDGNFLYVISGYSPANLKRINLNTEEIDTIEIPPLASHFIFTNNGEKLWVLGRTWPAHDEGYSHSEAYQHPNTGRLTEISLNTFTLIQTLEIRPLPLSLIYSDYTNKFYIWHEMQAYDPDTTQVVGDVVYETDPVTFEQEIFFHAGPDSGFEGFPQMELWSQDGRYLAIPNPAPNLIPNCITVFDLETWQDVTDVFFPQVEDVPFGVRHIRRLPETPFIYCTGWGRIDPENDDDPILEVNTETGEFQILSIPCSNLLTDIAISPNSCNIYLPSARTDEIYVLEKPNTPPLCDFFVVTPIPYLGPSLAQIEFDASASFDRDPCDELTYEWDFDGDLIFSEPVDDSYTGDPVNPTHEYTSDYEGPVHLRVTDPHSASSECLKLVIVDII